MNIWATITTIGVVAIAGYYLTAAFIVAKTGSTTGIGDLARGAGLPEHVPLRHGHFAWSAARCSSAVLT